ncbi:MAG TPA: hypothetical protein VGY30_04190 [Solirubrobacteraceae bacterium]|jgi:hypothetical protein|nr:hypothetical protein [Solirubrobacteraceae bacterium]
MAQVGATEIMVEDRWIQVQEPAADVLAQLEEFASEPERFVHLHDEDGDELWMRAGEIRAVSINAPKDDD